MMFMISQGALALLLQGVVLDPLLDFFASGLLVRVPVVAAKEVEFEVRGLA